MKIIEKDGKDLVVYELPDFINENKEIGSSLEDFEILRVIENSKYSRIFKVKSNKDLGIYAIKQIKLSFIQEYNLQKEINFFKKCNHPNIIKYFDSFFDSNYIYIIMEYMNNGDLESFYKLNYSFGKKVPIEKVWEICYASLSALDYIHSKDMKRKITIDNIYLDNNFKIKIGVLNFPSIIDYNSKKNDIVVLCESLKIFLNKNINNDDLPQISLFSLLDSIISGEKIDIKTAKKIAKEGLINYCVKNSSLDAIFHCLYNYQKIRTYFLDNYVFDFVCQDNKNTILSKQVLKIIRTLNTKDVTKDEIDDSLYEFRRALGHTIFNGPNDNVEISPENLLPFILIKLNTELNEVAFPKYREDAQKDENDRIIFKMLNKKTFFQEEEEKIKSQRIVDIYNEKISSLISRNFISFIESRRKCQNCSELTIKLSWIYFVCIPLSQIKNYFNFFNNIYESYFHNTFEGWCEHCKNKAVFNEYKSFYKSAKYLIVIFDTGIKKINNYYKDYHEVLELKNYDKEYLVTYKLKAIISKKIRKENLNGEIKYKYEYIYFIKDEVNNIWNSSKGRTLFDIIRVENEEKPIILFYEFDKEEKIFLSNKSDFKSFKASTSKTELHYGKQNSNLSREINNINNEIYNNINNTNVPSNPLSNRQQNMNPQLHSNKNQGFFNNNQNNLNTNQNSFFVNNNMNQNGNILFNQNNNNQHIGPQNNINNNIYRIPPNFQSGPINNINENLAFNLNMTKQNSFPNPFMDINKMIEEKPSIPIYYVRNDTSQEKKITEYIKGEKFGYPSQIIGLS